MASSVAQKAAVHKAESILQQAVQKAEFAQEEAKAAERQAAESAAHAVAHEEVSSSQTEVAEQVFIPPTSLSLRVPQTSPQWSFSALTKTLTALTACCILVFLG